MANLKIANITPKTLQTMRLFDDDDDDDADYDDDDVILHSYKIFT